MTGLIWIDSFGASMLMVSVVITGAEYDISARWG